MLDEQSNVRVLIPSRNEDLLDVCLSSMESMEKNSSRVVVVGDDLGNQGLGSSFRGKWNQVSFVDVQLPFVINRSLNTLVDSCPPGTNFLITNDDVEILTPNWLRNIEELFASWPKGYGALNLAERELSSPVEESPTTFAFVATLIPAPVWKLTGMLDERYTGYGFDDTDYFLRMLHTGHKLGLTSAVKIKHLGTQTFMKRFEGWGGVIEQAWINFQLFYDKWETKRPDPPTIEFFPASAHYLRNECSCSTKY